MSSYGQIAGTLRSAGCVFAEDEARLLVEAGGSPELIARRVAGEPLEHVLGWAEFCGQRIVVTPGVFVPRRRTEFLARSAAGLARPGSVLLDLCCGSAAVATSLGTLLPGVSLHAVDIDPIAVACARRNLAPLGGHTYTGDLFAPLPADLRFDLIIANTPYVPTDEIGLMPPEAREHEAIMALDGGADGLDIQRRVVREAPDRLVPGGVILIESSEPQADALAAVFTEAGLLAAIHRCADLGAVVVSGR
ncbi:putative protein N(5)-glutamine methyltransferase [Pseudonocardiaceae bacterium YIM PH 21723]|nr:putative protein N(5)-glutamine methyltransferase [Pseudonocardiaceae bacterium YIM PH 21723]